MSHALLRHLASQVQQRNGGGLVVSGGGVATCTNRCHHFVLAGVTFSRGVLLDRADRNALVGNLVVLAPGSELSHESAVGMGRVDTNVAADLFEHDLVDAVIALLDVGEPALEPQKAHAAAFEALGFKGLAATGDRKSTRLNSSH